MYKLWTTLLLHVENMCNSLFIYYCFHHYSYMLVISILQNAKQVYRKLPKEKWVRWPVLLQYKGEVYLEPQQNFY